MLSPNLSRHQVCLVPRNWGIPQIASRNCKFPSHWHITRLEVAELVELSIVEWVVYPKHSRKERGAARILRQIPVSGFSSKYGFGMEGAPDWFRVMIAQSRLQRESPSMGLPA